MGALSGIGPTTPQNQDQRPIEVADVRIKGSPQVKGKDVIDVAKKVADKIAEKTESRSAKRVAEKIDALDRGRAPTIIKTDKIDLQVTIEGNVDPFTPRKSELGVEFKIKF